MARTRLSRSRKTPEKVSWNRHISSGIRETSSRVRPSSLESCPGSGCHLARSGLFGTGGSSLRASPMIERKVRIQHMDVDLFTPPVVVVAGLDLGIARHAAQARKPAAL